MRHTGVKPGVGIKRIVGGGGSCDSAGGGGRSCDSAGGGGSCDSAGGGGGGSCKN